jgi:hypothetical protein
MNTASNTTLPLVLSLDGTWDFTYTIEAPAGDAPAPLNGAAFDATMTVPGRWDDHTDQISHTSSWSKARFNPAYRPIGYPMGNNPPDASLPYLLGTGWYRRTFRTITDHHVTLQIGGVCMEAWLWLNGTFLCHHQDHATPIAIDLDPSLLRDGDNELIMAVANTREDRLGCDIRGYKGKSGGVTGTCQLLTWQAARISDCYLYADSDLTKLHWHIEVNQPRQTAPLKLCCRLRDTNGNVVREAHLSVDGPVVELDMDTTALPRWSDQNPHLLRAEAELYDGEKCIYKHRQPFGLRRLTRNGTGLLLNGVPIYLCGITEHAYFPETCTPPLDVRIYRRNIRRFKSLGFNWLRFHTWVPPQAYLQAADELGMLVQIEPPVNFSEDQWLRILRHTRSHPCVTIYCAGNEERLDETKIVQLENYARQQKDLVPDALFNPQEALRGVEYHWAENEEGLVKQPFLHHPGRLEKLKTFSDVFGTYSWGKLSYSSAEADMSDMDQRLALYERPCLSHEITIHGSYLNLDLEHRYQGTRIGTDIFASARQLLQRSGRLHRAARYYQCSAALHAELRKHAIESARRCRLLSGYNMLGAIDAHWHRSGYTCGLMNEFYESKGQESVEQTRQYNDQCVLLCDLPNRRNLLVSQKVDWPLLVSLYGVRQMQHGTLNWHVSDATGHTIITGSNKASAEPGGISEIGRIHFTATPTNSPQRFNLHARFQTPELTVDNTWAFWIVPEQETVADGKICHTLDEQAIEKLEAGADLLLLGCGPFPNIDIRYQQALAGRPNGHLGTVVEEHPLMKRIPHEGWCDRFFFDMLNGAKAIVMDGLTDRFEPIIEVIGSYKQASAFAALFECRVGHGRLLVCTLNLRPDDPGACWLRAAMLRYINSDDFTPSACMAPNVLRRLLVHESRTITSTATDEAFDLRAQIRRQ